VSEKWVERATCPLRRATSPPETGRQVAARDRLVACSTNFQTGSKSAQNLPVVKAHDRFKKQAGEIAAFFKV